MDTRHLLLLTILLAMPATLRAQTVPGHWSPEVSIGAGLGHVFRWEDQVFGDRLNLGGSLAVAHDSGWAIEVESDRTFGLDPPQTPCGLVGVTCVGVARDGPRSLTVASMAVHYRFTRTRFQPYLIAGVGVMWSISVHSLTLVRGPIALVTESETRDRGLGPDLGAGLRFPIGRNWTVSPEIRWLEASWLSRENLSATRVVLRSTYSW